MSDFDQAGLYLHVPFCTRVCPYCDFAVRTGDRARRRRFVDHLLAEIDLYAGFPLQFDTIYFGGGTPSSLLPEELAQLVAASVDRLSCAERTWIFLEVNPEDVSVETLDAWRRIGVATLSLGVQSLDADHLAFLGRRHSVEQARRSVELALGAGFHTVSIDLIYGLPGQTPEDWRAELDRALALGVQHISCYQLTIHERTRFALLERRGLLTQLPTDGQAELFRLAHQHLAAAGMPGYEVSQFAISPTHHSRHNVKYWNHTPYLGLGPSAHSFHEDRRWWNLRSTDPWQAAIEEGRHPVEASERLEAQELVLESLMTGLRTHAGVSLERIRSRWGIDLAARNATLIERLTAEGLLAPEGDRLVPTLDGLAVADALAARFEI